MSAMMAVSAAPAVTVMAANETAEEATNTGATEQYKVEAAYKESPVLFLNNTKTSYSHIQGVVDNKTLKDDELKSVAAGTKVTDVKITSEDGTDLLQGGVYEYTVKKATPTITVDQSGKVTAPDAEVKNATVVSLQKFNTSVGQWVDYDKAAVGTNGKYRYKAEFAGSANYNAAATAYSTDFSVNTFAENDLEVVVNNSTYTDATTVSVPAYEERSIKATIYPQLTKQKVVDGAKKTVVENGPAITGSVVDGKLVLAEGQEGTDTVTFKDGSKKTFLKAGTYNYVLEATNAENGKTVTEKQNGVTVAKKAADGITLQKSSGVYHDVAYYPANGASVYVNLTNAKGETEKVTTISGKAIADNFKFDVSNSKKNTAGLYVSAAGTYTVTATAKDDDTDVTTTKGAGSTVTLTNTNPEDYYINNFAKSVNTTFTITGNLPQTIKWNSDKYEKEYDGTPVDVKADAQTGAATLTYTDAAGKALASAPSDAGTYYVTATAKADKNYGEKAETRKIVINRKKVTVNDLFSNMNSRKYLGTVTYDGAVQSPVVTTENDALENLNQITLATGKHTLVPGDFKVTATGKNATVVAGYGSYDSNSAAKTYDGNGRIADQYTAKLSLQGNYELVDKDGKETSVDVYYDIAQYTLKAADVTVKNAEPGKTPEVVVKAVDGKVIPASDYTVTVANNENVGTGNVTIAGTGKNVIGSVNKEYNVVKAATVEKTDLYRLYNKNTGEHFFTTSAGEKNNLVTKGWNFEGVAMKTLKEGGTPVYRLYNKNNGGEHVYTTHKGEANSLVRAGWAYEGVAFNAAKKGDKDAVKVYRVYNKNQIANNHHYTQSWGEKTVLVKKGWRDEGVAFYAYKAL